MGKKGKKKEEHQSNTEKMKRGSGRGRRQKQWGMKNVRGREVAWA
jgi:hypothetical protein